MRDFLKLSSYALQEKGRECGNVQTRYLYRMRIKRRKP